jgi:O-methyltransferase involved in polyketide biosynthesis
LIKTKCYEKKGFVMTISLQNLDLVEETALFPVYYRALESQRPDGLIQDPRAVELVKQIDYDFSKLKIQSFVQVALILRVRQFDLLTRDFLTRHPNGVVVYVGCGLDTGFDRVDNDQVEWYDLDLPEVIEVRRQLLPETPRSHLIGCSVLDPAWMERIGKLAGRSLLVRAEAVLPYLPGEDVKRMVLALADRFPGAELVCDTISPLVVKIQNLGFFLSGMKVRLQWGLSNGREFEAWHPGFQLLSEWRHFDQPEPRLGLSRLLRYIPVFGKGARVMHYRLGN